MKILVGVDDSPHSMAAIDYVKQMPWPAGSEVVLVSAVRPIVPIYTEVYVPATVELEQLLEARTRHHQELLVRAEQALQAAGLRARGCVLQGDPREALVEMGKREAAGLIVVGSHGRSGLTKLLMGSVASHVVTHAPCNVLVVRLNSGSS